MRAVVCIAVAFMVFVARTEAVNPLSRYGRCKNVKPYTDFKTKHFEGVWYLQHRPLNDDNYAHTCQATYEKQTENLHSFLYYYNMDIPVNRPIHAEYEYVSKGKYRGHIDVDGEVVTIYWNVLYVDDKSRLIYMCADHQRANPDLNAVFIWSREQKPSKSDTERARNKLKEYSQLHGTLVEAVQDFDKCAPLQVYYNLFNPFVYLKAKKH